MAKLNLGSKREHSSILSLGQACSDLLDEWEKTRGL